MRELVEAPTLGIWSVVLRGTITDLRRHHLDRAVLDMLNSLSKRHKYGDEAFDEVRAASANILESMDCKEFPFSPSWLGIVEVLVLYRNKTAHGASPPEWFASVADDVSLITERLISRLTDSPLAFAVRRPDSGRYLVLRGAAEHHVQPPDDSDDGETIVVAIDTDDKPSPPRVRLVGRDAPIAHFDVTRDRFSFVNSAVGSDGKCEFLDYFAGDRSRMAIPTVILEAVPPPKSVTTGALALDWSDVIPNNLPQYADAWISRQRLESQLRTTLLKRQQPMVTLHGIGGSGKTSLALRVARELAGGTDHRFDFIVWLSARDVDLLSTGQRATQRDVADVFEIADTFARLLEDDARGADALELLSEELSTDNFSYLVILDNFETLDDPARVQKFFVDRVLPPNKVLITTRLRAFEADMPIEVGGLERLEAEQLMLEEARSRYSEGILSPDLRLRVFEATSGIAYAIKLAIAQISSGVHPQHVLQTVRSDPSLVEALFRRSFDALGADAQHLVLLVGKLRMKVPDLFLRVTFARRGLSYHDAEDEARKQALIQREVAPSGEYVFSVAQVARAFLKSELTVSAFRPAVEDDAALISQLRYDPAVDEVARAEAIARDIVGRLGDTAQGDSQAEDLVAILEELARVHPGVWVFIAELRRAAGEDSHRVLGAIKQGLRSDPSQLDLWLYWIRHRVKEASFDEALSLAGQAAEACGQSADAVCKVGRVLLEIVSEPSFHKSETDKDSAVSAVETALARHASALSPAENCTLAWLRVHLGDVRGALNAVQQGLKQDPRNHDLLNLLSKIRERHPTVFVADPKHDSP